MLFSKIWLEPMLFRLTLEPVAMKRYQSLIQETWWLWLLFFVVGCVMSWLSLVFLLTFPICIFVFFWFAFVRYDEDGNFKGT